MATGPATPAVSAPPAPPPATEAKSESDWYLKGRFLVGASWGSVATFDGDLGTQYKVSPFFRWNSRRSGWGPSFGLSWYEADLRLPVDGKSETLGPVKVRPVMAGVGYSIIKGRTRTSLGLVAGYAFNKATVDRQLPPGYTATVELDSTWSAGPKADVMFAATRRIALIASVAYVFSNPDVTVTLFKDGQPVLTASDHLRGDSFSVRVGAAVSLF